MQRVILLIAVMALCACQAGDQITLAEAREALEQVVVSGEGEAVTSEVIEISTDFTLGEAAAVAAEELYNWFVSQLPCSEVALDGTTVVVDYGTLDDACVYNGHTYAGLSSVTVDRTDEDDVQVTHHWDGLTNGDITLDGEAVVTWSGDAEGVSRHVVHDLWWTDEAGHRIDATGDRTQALLRYQEGLGFGLRVTGTRDWTYEGDAWSLEIDDVEMWGQDPVPTDGSYTVTNPDGKELSIVFERLGDDSIQVTVTGMRRDFVFEVSRAGDIEGEG